ncbi:cytochrome P450 302a1, mitochondrial isoform X1 [Bombus pascuorum]|uniref:cytochrome P450 302a1, mitochondrial isoform X1 n=1 Tax=Bombus pascuorum TaxID=65598 RepID=UPI00213841B9|nr:cytochrome P450 302a1, mitochondrial isoform X1 [Bombus pascuorum]XP_060823546.1 cytochrome P450 302a1, mitochondrial isoform X1 [Bombus pascuorum]
MYTWLRKYSPYMTKKKLYYIKFYSANFAKCNIKTNNHPPKAFNNIPGPKSLPVIGTLYKYLPFIGEYSFTNLYESGKRKLEQFGPLVREEIVPNVNLVLVYRPEDIAEIFKAESSLHPERRSHLALLKYRKDRTDVYNTGGLLPTNGTEWWRLRKEFQKVSSKPQDVINYLKKTDDVIQEFIGLCINEKFDDFLPLLSRLFLELTCLVVFDVRLNSFSKEERCENSKSSKLINAAFTTNSVMLKLDNGLQLWRYFETPLYRKLRKAQTYMEMVALELVSQKKQNTKTGHNKSFLNAYLENPALDIKDIVGMACDMLLAGVDTTTYSTAFALYHLARHQDVQEKLRIEATQLLADHSQPITAGVLRNASYTKAVIKESLRLNPISIGIGRILQNNIVLNGYQVPKGTVVVTQNQVTCRLPEYFNKPDLFIPERWLREHSESSSNINCGKSVHPYVLLPFGHGPRSCIARRFAEQNMQVLLLRMCQRLKIFWHGGELGMISLLINKPDAPLKFNFREVLKTNSTCFQKNEIV